MTLAFEILSIFYGDGIKITEGENHYDRSNRFDMQKLGNKNQK